jgi:hypothetical protein
MNLGLIMARRVSKNKIRVFPITHRWHNFLLFSNDYNPKYQGTAINFSLELDILSAE